MKNIKEKILLLLLGGLAFGCAYTPNKQRIVIKTVVREWKRLNKNDVYKEMRVLNRSKLVEKNKNADGSFTFVITKKGKLKALTYYFQNMKISNKKWDGKWRIVTFDIPEKNRVGRNALRSKIKELGFCELQKSVFIFPYECEDEISFIIEFFGLSKHVRFGVLEYIDNGDYLKDLFKLS